MTEPAPRMFQLVLVATAPGDPYHGIRALLKLALRRYGLRCTMARELPPPNPKPDRTRAHENNPGTDVRLLHR